jgi:hypothetical protein
MMHAHVLTFTIHNHIHVHTHIRTHTHMRKAHHVLFTWSFVLCIANVLLTHTYIHTPYMRKAHHVSFTWSTH